MTRVHFGFVTPPDQLDTTRCVTFIDLGVDYTLELLLQAVVPAL